MTFGTEDLWVVTRTVVDAWRSASDRDWSVRAGALEWTCQTTADHAVDTVLAPAFFLASRKTDGYPAFEPFTLGTDPSVAQLVEGLETAVRILDAVVVTAEPEARAAIWIGTQVEVRDPADFVPRAGLELVLHAHDVCTGLGVPFGPPTDACQRLREHTRAWPAWSSPGWKPLGMSGDPWRDLLRSAGRVGGET